VWSLGWRLVSQSQISHLLKNFLYDRVRFTLTETSLLLIKYTTRIMYRKQEPKSFFQYKIIMNKRTINREPNVKCSHCQTPFFKWEYRLQLHTKHFCSNECKKENQGRRLSVACAKCDKNFMKDENQVNKTKNNFCSRSCAASFNNTHKTYGTRRAKLEIYLEEQIKEYYPELELICNQKTAIESELDFYFPQLRFAIELNGITHYEPIYGEDKFEKIQSNDKRKVIACYEKGIELAIIDSSSCSYLSPNNKEKYKRIVFNLIEKVRHRA